MGKPIERARKSRGRTSETSSTSVLVTLAGLVCVTLAAISCSKGTPNLMLAPAPQGGTRLGTADSAGAIDYVINAVTGERASKRTFNRNQTIRIVVEDVNPFLYAYAIQIADEQVIVEANPMTFFTIAFKGLELPLGAAPAAANMMVNLDKGPPFCPELRDAIANAKPQDKGRLSDSLAKIEDTAAIALKNHIRSATAFRDTLELSDSHIGQIAERQNAVFTAEMLTVLDASRIADSVRAHADVASAALLTFAMAVDDTVPKMQRILRKMDLALRSANAELAGPLSGYRAGCHGLDQLLVDLSTRLSAEGTALQKLINERTRVRSAYAKMRAISTDRSRYSLVRTLKRFDAATDVTVRVLRKPVGSKSSFELPSAPGGERTAANTERQPEKDKNKDKTVTAGTTLNVNLAPQAAPPSAPVPLTVTDTTFINALGDDASPVVVTEQRLHIGSRGRLSIGIGLLYSDLPQVQYRAIRQEIVPIAGHVDTAEFVVGTSEASNYRIIPALTLNTAVASLNWGPLDALHLSLGTGLRLAGVGTDVEYMFGGGLSLFDSRLMLTSGLYLGRFRTLDNVRLGERLSSSTVPTRNNLERGFAAGLTYRIR